MGDSTKDIPKIIGKIRDKREEREVISMASGNKKLREVIELQADKFIGSDDYIRGY